MLSSLIIMNKSIINKKIENFKWIEYEQEFEQMRIHTDKIYILVQIKDINSWAI